MLSLNLNSIGAYSPHIINTTPIEINDKLLSDKEMYLVNGYINILNAGCMLARLLDGEQDDEFHLQRKEAWSKVKEYPDFFKLTEQVFDSPGYIDVRDLPNFNLPKRGYSVNRTTNSITIGIGSTVDLGAYSFIIGNNHIEIKHAVFRSRYEV